MIFVELAKLQNRQKSLMLHGGGSSGFRPDWSVLNSHLARCRLGRVAQASTYPSAVLVTHFFLGSFRARRQFDPVAVDGHETVVGDPVDGLPGLRKGEPSPQHGVGQHVARTLAIRP